MEDDRYVRKKRREVKVHFPQWNNVYILSCFETEQKENAGKKQEKNRKGG